MSNDTAELSVPTPAQAEALGIPAFRHQHSGHCESGVASSLISHAGLPLSEPMAFGLASALIFVHMPWIRVGGLPLTAYRTLPGHIMGKLRKGLKLDLVRQRFSDAKSARQALDAQLARGRPVGLQTSVFWLPYFPKDMRFHFNAHNLIVYGKEGDEYLISDPVFDQPQRCDADSLDQARFVRGAFAPRGLMYYLKDAPTATDYAPLIPSAIKRTVRMNLHAPLPMVGVRAIRRLAETIRRLPGKHRDPRYTRLFVGNVIRMQEEIGTGGAGFRFMYASFLQEAAERLEAPALSQVSQQMTETGDRWRDFALQGSLLCRGQGDQETVADALIRCAEHEVEVYKALKTALRTL